MTLSVTDRRLCNSQQERTILPRAQLFFAFVTISLCSTAESANAQAITTTNCSQFGSDITCTSIAPPAPPAESPWGSIGESIGRAIRAAKRGREESNLRALPAQQLQLENEQLRIAIASAQHQGRRNQYVRPVSESETARMISELQSDHVRINYRDSLMEAVRTEAAGRLNLRGPAAIAYRSDAYDAYLQVIKKSPDANGAEIRSEIDRVTADYTARCEAFEANVTAAFGALANARRYDLAQEKAFRDSPEVQRAVTHQFETNLAATQLEIQAALSGIADPRK